MRRREDALAKGIDLGLIVAAAVVLATGGVDYWRVIVTSPEAIAAAGLIAEDRRDVGLLAVTSSDRLNAG